jgi:hypothetical protein
MRRFSANLKWLVYGLFILFHWYLVAGPTSLFPRDEALVGLGTKSSTIEEVMPGSSEGTHSFTLMISNRWTDESSKDYIGASVFLNMWRENAKTA